MFNVELSVGGFGGHAVVALHGDLDLAAVPAVASHLNAAVAACGPLIIVNLAGLAHSASAGAPGRPMPSRLPVLASAPSWHEVRTPGNAAVGSYWLN